MVVAGSGRRRDVAYRWPGLALDVVSSKRTALDGEEFRSTHPSTVMPGCAQKSRGRSRSGDRRWCCRGRAAAPLSPRHLLSAFTLPCSGARRVSVSAWPTLTSWDVVLTMRSKHCGCAAGDHGLQRGRLLLQAAKSLGWAAPIPRNAPVAVASARSAAPATPPGVHLNALGRKSLRGRRADHLLGAGRSCTAPGGLWRASPPGPTQGTTLRRAGRRSSSPLRDGDARSLRRSWVLVGTRDWATPALRTRQLCWPGLDDDVFAWRGAAERGGSRVSRIRRRRADRSHLHTAARGRWSLAMGRAHSRARPGAGIATFGAMVADRSGRCGETVVRGDIAPGEIAVTGRAVGHIRFCRRCGGATGIPVHRCGPCPSVTCCAETTQKPALWLPSIRRALRRRREQLCPVDATGPAVASRACGLPTPDPAQLPEKNPAVHHGDGTGRSRPDSR